MRATKRQHFVKLLLAERARLESTLARISPPAATVFADDRASPGRDAGWSALGVSEEDDSALAANAARSLAAVDATLQLLHESPERYGKCATCGANIALERLEVVPTATQCQRHAPPG